MPAGTFIFSIWPSGAWNCSSIPGTADGGNCTAIIRCCCCCGRCAPCCWPPALAPSSYAGLCAIGVCIAMGFCTLSFTLLRGCISTARFFFFAFVFPAEDAAAPARAAPARVAAALAAFARLLVFALLQLSEQYDTQHTSKNPPKIIASRQIAHTGIELLSHVKRRDCLRSWRYALAQSRRKSPSGSSPSRSWSSLSSSSHTSAGDGPGSGLPLPSPSPLLFGSSLLPYGSSLLGSSFSGSSFSGSSLSSVSSVSSSPQPGHLKPGHLHFFVMQPKPTLAFNTHPEPGQNAHASTRLRIHGSFVMVHEQQSVLAICEHCENGGGVGAGVGAGVPAPGEHCGVPDGFHEQPPTRVQCV